MVMVQFRQNDKPDQESHNMGKQNVDIEKCILFILFYVLNLYSSTSHQKQLWTVYISKHILKGWC